MSFSGLLDSTAVHLRPVHDKDSGERSIVKLREHIKVRVDRGTQSLETLPLGSGTFASGAHVAYLSGLPEDWREGDYIEVEGRRFEILSVSSTKRNRRILEATVIEKGPPE